MITYRNLIVGFGLMPGGWSRVSRKKILSCDLTVCYAIKFSFSSGFLVFGLFILYLACLMYYLGFVCFIIAIIIL